MCDVAFLDRLTFFVVTENFSCDSYSFQHDAVHLGVVDRLHFIPSSVYSLFAVPAVVVPVEVGRLWESLLSRYYG